MSEQSNRVSKALRDYADKIDYIQSKFGVEPKVLQGQACLYEKTTFDMSKADKKKLWRHIDKENNGFIGIMPNQWRPEVYVKAIIKGIPIYLYRYASHGFHHYDGGFLDEYENIRKEFKEYNAPDFIIEKLDNLYKECIENNEKGELRSKKEKLKKELQEIEEKEKLYGVSEKDIVGV